MVKMKDQKMTYTGKRIFKYCTFSEAYKDMVCEITELEIIDSFYEYWYSRMIKKYSTEELEKMDLKGLCIKDWVANNWAWEVK
jgi:hypothetical protein